MTDGTGGGSWVAAMNSINLSMKNVLARNEANRVGLVAFSNKAQEILPLDRYTADDDKYLTSTSEVYSVTYPSFKNIYGTTKAAQTVNLAVNITTVGSLNYEGGTKEGSIRSAGQVAQKKMNFLGAWEKTNTQEGLQLAYEVFLEMKAMSDDYLTFEAGGEELPRQPVIILVTDGDPTICTYNYMYPKAGPTYGQGKSVGVEGYYTILTANYFKNLTSILYQRLAGFYTIGINCYTNYQLAVLDPTEARVKACQGGDAETANQLYQLLEDIGPGTGTTGGTFTQNVKPQEAGTDAQGQQLYYLEYSRGVLGLGINTPVIRGVYNPYLSDYNYCDKAWFGSLTEEGMNAIFENILNRVQLINNYNFLLKENTSLVMTDYIGDSMTVKGVPVLRYFGKNYAPDADTVEGTDSSGSYVIYKWTQTAERLPSDSKEKEGTAVSLSGISARVTTAADGSQTVTFTVPEDALPTYYPDLYKTFYYEELPVRLIYRVGLTDEEIESLNSVSGAITEQTYYTSLFNQESGEAYTTAIFTPAESNPYYTSGLDKTTDKLDNITETSSYSFSETVNADGKTVTQLLGNNGRLTVSRSDMLNLTVKKGWAAGTAPAKSVRVLLYATGTRQKTGEDESQEGTWMIGSATLNADNGWKYTWKNLSKDGSGPYYSYEYSSFYIAEAAMDAYDVTYQDEKGNKLGTEKLLVDISDVTLKPGETAEVKAASANSGTIVIVNADPYVLPHAGGIGTNWFTLSGTTIVIAACFVYIFIRYRKRQTRKGGEV
jgi:LPXTG-motif cell wall-anchored protein